MRISIVCCFLFVSVSCLAQITESPNEVKSSSPPIANYLGLKFGVLASGFGHGSGGPSSGLRQFGWHAGVAADLFSRERYNARAEISYITKGARETFGNDRIEIDARNRLSYVQLSVLPLVLKHQFGKVKPYIGLGGYYARRVGIKSEWKPGTSWENDIHTRQNLNVRNDFGYSISLGVYVKKRPLGELRYEGGLNDVSSTSKIKNRSLVLSITI